MIVCTLHMWKYFYLLKILNRYLFLHASWCFNEILLPKISSLECPTYLHWLVNLILTFSKIVFNLQSCWQLAYKSTSPLGKCVARTQLPSYALSAVLDAVAGSSVGLPWMNGPRTHLLMYAKCQGQSSLICSAKLQVFVATHRFSTTSLLSGDVIIHLPRLPFPPRATLSWRIKPRA